MLRVDVYSYGPDCFAFEEAIIWRDNLLIGFAGHVHAVSIADRSVVTYPLHSYFGHIYPTEDYVLAASADALLRIEPDRTVLWRRPGLGLDGVVVNDPGPPIIRGEGEWDPPGGWRPFVIDAARGEEASP